MQGPVQCNCGSSCCVGACISAPCSVLAVCRQPPHLIVSVVAGQPPNEDLVPGVLNNSLAHRQACTQ
jgi:hypothetical protein